MKRRSLRIKLSMALILLSRPDEAQLKDRNEAYLYIDIYVVLENLFHLHRGHDLFNKAKSMAALRTFKVRREDTVLQLLEMMTVALVSEQMAHHCCQSDMKILY